MKPNMITNFQEEKHEAKSSAEIFVSYSSVMLDGAQTFAADRKEDRGTGLNLQRSRELSVTTGKKTLFGSTVTAKIVVQYDW